MAGNLLGPRAKIVYLGDDGKNYKIVTDASFVVEKAGAATAAPALFDAASPPTNYAGRFPRGAKPRVVFAQDTAGNRKEVVCTDATSALFKTTLPQVVSIDGTDFTTTGRRGETYSF